jgi:ABC-type multidrug transport system, ATPase component
MKLITIPAGTAIGYRPNQPIIKAEERIELPSKGLFLLVGQNGMGKTTFMKHLVGCLPQSKGPMDRAVYLPERFDLPEYLPPRKVAKSCLNHEARRQFLGDANVLKVEVGKEFYKLSKGNKQKTVLAFAIARATDNQSKVLLLDEPLSGLDYAVQKDAWILFNRERQRRLVILSMHPDHIETPPDALLVIKNGRISKVEGNFESWGDIERVLTGESLTVSV